MAHRGGGRGSARGFARREGARHPARPGAGVHGSFALPQALQAQAASPNGTGGAFASIGAAPTQLLSYAGPVSNDLVALTFKQVIAVTDPLRTGSYGKTLTFTLSTTNP